MANFSPATFAHLGNYIQGYINDIHIEYCISDQFPHKIPIYRGGSFLKKLPTPVFGAQYWGPF